jgi:hypothetical protein
MYVFIQKTCMLTIIFLEYDLLLPRADVEILMGRNNNRIIII